MHHRGPDESGIWHRDGVGIAMTRLSIIDIAGGSQPVHNEDKTIWIVFNGEIYNYRELRTVLEKQGHEFYTNSDTECIVHLYEEHGADCVKHLRGMFAFAIWDTAKDTLLLARDRLGIKPLHYFWNGKQLVFASEIKAILQCNVPRAVYPPSLATYVFFGYVTDPFSIFKDIFKVPPGHTLVLKHSRITVQKYWDVEYNIEKVYPEEYYIERLIDILTDAVRVRLMSEVPLGAFLSGGIDSGIVVALMAMNMAEPVKTFSVGFTYQKYSELKYARLVAQKYGTDHHEEIVTPDAEGMIHNLVTQFDEPFADHSAIPTYLVAKTSKRHVTVALSGDGGDELFGGYSRYRTGPLVRYSSCIPLKFRKPVFFKLSNLLPGWFPGTRTLRYLSGNKDEQYLSGISNELAVVHKKVFSTSFAQELKSADPVSIMWDHLNEVASNDLLTRRQYLDLKTYLPGDILTKLDRTSMLVSLEARVPILDHHLVEFAATIPPEMRVRGMNTKYLLKKVAERLLPKDVIYRPKMGFSIPAGQWIREEWSDISHELVLGERARARNIFNPRFLNSIFHEHRLRRRDHTYKIWTIMMLELWLRHFVD